MSEQVVVSPCVECGRDQLRVEREIGALGQAVRNYLLHGTAEDLYAMDRLAAEALGLSRVVERVAFAGVADSDRVRMALEENCE